MIFYKNKSAKELRENIRNVLKKVTNIAGESFEEYEYTPVSPMVLMYSDEVPADVYFKKGCIMVLLNGKSVADLWKKF